MKRIIFNFCFVWLAVSAFAGSKVVEMRNYGLVPDTHENLSAKLQKALQDIKTQVASGDKVTLLFESGRYDFHPEGAAVREYYISNHDQDNPKTVRFSSGGLEGADRGRTRCRFYLSWPYASTFSASFRGLYFT